MQTYIFEDLCPDYGKLLNSIDTISKQCIEHRKLINANEGTDVEETIKLESQASHNLFELFEELKRIVIESKDTLQQLVESENEENEVIISTLGLSATQSTEIRHILKADMGFRIIKINDSIYVESQSKYDTYTREELNKDLDFEAEEEEDEIKKNDIMEKIKNYKGVPDKVTELYIKQYNPSSQVIEIVPTIPFCFNSKFLHFNIKIDALNKSWETTHSSKYKKKVPNNKGIISLEFEIKGAPLLILCIEAFNLVGGSKKSSFKIAVPSAYKIIRMKGDNSLNQITKETVSDEIKHKYFNEEAGDKDTIPELVDIAFDFEDKSLQPRSLVSKDTTLAIVSNWQLVQWGATIMEDEENGGTMVQPSSIFLPYNIEDKPMTFCRVSVGNNFMVAISTLGKVFSWGMNQYGQLGHGDLITRYTPTMISDLKDRFIIDVSCGDYHTLNLDISGDVYSWGFKQALNGTPVKDRYGSIINFDNQGIHQPTPNLISTGCGNSKSKIAKIEAMSLTSGMLSDAGELYLWGNNAFSQIGPQFCASPARPVRLDLPPLQNFALSEDASLALTKDNRLIGIGQGLVESHGNWVDIKFEEGVVVTLFGNCVGAVVQTQDGRCFTQAKEVDGNYLAFGWKELKDAKGASKVIISEKSSIFMWE